LTAGDWAAAVITFGWAATGFLVVHVITRRPRDAKQRPDEDDADDGRDRSGDGRPGISR
jgi:hypothetical protein